MCFGTLLVAVMLAALPLTGCEMSDAKPSPLTVYCAAGVRGPMEQAAKAWTAETGQLVHLQYGGSGTLLSNLRVAPRADLYLAAAKGYVDQAQSFGLIDERIPLATQQLVIVVPKGNPAGIGSIDDLLDGEVRLALPDPSAAAAGRTAARVLQDAGVWERLQQSVVVTKPTVNEVVTDVRLGAADAAIAWNTTVALLPGVEAVRDAALDGTREDVVICVIRSSSQPGAALRFARFLGARDKGAPMFRAAGFQPVKGDVWAEQPRMTLFAGGMLRPVLEPIIKSFCQREGVIIDRSYNGCGTLVAQMRNGAVPDAYAACDQAFLDMVQSDFTAGHLLSRNEIVLLVPRGNPSGIKTAQDLVRPGLRIGLASPTHSALGVLSVGALTRAGLMDALRASGNIAVESPTGDFLVNQVRVGALDGALVYRSNALAIASVREHTDLVEVNLPGSTARQPWSVRLDSPHAVTLGRLLERIEAARAAGAFTDVGFLPPEAPQP